MLNEITNVSLRKLGMSWAEINQFLAPIRSLCIIESLTVETHNRGREVAERYGLSVYDSMIASAALIAGCTTLYSDGMQHGLLVDKQLRMVNPFKAT